VDGTIPLKKFPGNPDLNKPPKLNKPELDVSKLLRKPVFKVNKKNNTI
jgi:hypothetical protein